jgi:hypothetical protein
VVKLSLVTNCYCKDANYLIIKQERTETKQGYPKVTVVESQKDRYVKKWTSSH